jgi:hypothetical protein
MIAIYGFNTDNQWEIINLLTLEEYLNYEHVTGCTI